MANPQRGPTTDDGKDGRLKRRNVRFEAVGVTDIGRQRKHNEDYVLLRPELDLFVVADGMGGHNAGDIASKLATVSLRNFYEATLDGAVPDQNLSDGYSEYSEDARRLVAGIRKANRDVHEISSTYRQHHGMGSTVVAAFLARDRAVMHVGHVGDSRCYRFREGRLLQLTHDHSLINDALALKPDLTQEELSRLPKNIITRALGMKEDVKVDIRSEDVKEGDIFLLCSDGLSGMVSEEEIVRVLELATDKNDLRDVCETLVSLANEAGGNDNITALLIRIDDLDDPEPQEGDTDIRGSGADDTEDGEPDGDESDDVPDVEAGNLARMNTQELEAVAADEASEGLVTCPACHAEIDGSNVFCTECGATIDPAAHD